jgi:hypothetical protein
MRGNKIADYESEKLTIDCPDIVLEPIAGKTLKRLNGPGSIIQEAGGGFLLKVFIAEQVDIIAAFERINRIKAGKIIGSSEYYRMSATDMYGNVWTCDRLYPEFSTSFENPNSILTSNLFQISKTSALPKKISESTLQLKFNGNFKIPANSGSHITKQVSDILREEKSHLNVCKFSSCSIDIGIIQEDKWMIVTATSADRELDEGVAARIKEAIQLCMSRQLEWSSSTISKGTEHRTVLRGIIPNEEKGRVYPPVNYHSPANVNDAIRLMDRYLTRTIDSKDSSVHSLFHPLYAVILASQSTTESEALALSTSVESILDNAIKVEQDKKVIEALKKLRKYINSSKYPDNFKKRISGLLGMMTSPSAVEKLNHLVEKKVITKDLVYAWKKLRPKLAHGNYAVDDFQEFLDLVHSVHVLLHHLLFHCIGYSGKYTDYSKEGWPTLEYPNTSGNIEQMN